MDASSSNRPDPGDAAGIPAPGNDLPAAPGATAPEAGPGTVLVTGASKGIGRATALHLERLGFSVLAGVRREADAAALRSAAGGRLTPVLLDVTDAGAIRGAAAAAAAAAGERGLAGLVNNAGIAVAAPLEFLPSDELRRQLEVNVVGQLAVTRELLPLLRRGRGRIVNLGSVADRLATPFLGPYAASKFALRALSDSLRMELRRHGVEVVLIEPGVIATPIWSTSIAAGETLHRRLPPELDRYYGRALERVRARAEQAGRTGLDPDVVARAIAHALTTSRPRARYLVGRDARTAALVAALPDRVRDRLIAGARRPPREPDVPASPPA
jgi:NAD(P)-dependent dehydrogenase (short-subunit alcohol dehydrogenase family)